MVHICDSACAATAARAATLEARCRMLSAAVGCEGGETSCPGEVIRAQALARGAAARKRAQAMRCARVSAHLRRMSRGMLAREAARVRDRALEGALRRRRVRAAALIRAAYVAYRLRLSGRPRSHDIRSIVALRAKCEVQAGVIRAQRRYRRR